MLGWDKLAYKLLALDLDGTLLNKNQSLDPEIKNTIKKLKMLDIRILIATGRMFISALPYIKELNLSGPMITYNGAYIRKHETDEILYHKPLKKEVAQMLIEEAQKHNLHIQIYHNDNLYVEQRNKIINRYEKISGVDATCLKELSNLDGAPTKLLIIEDERDKFEYYYKYFIDKYGDKVEVAESITNFLELGAKGVNKGQALQYIAENFNIKKNEVVSAGDSWNDSEMISWSEIGIAMNNAPQDLKEKADIIAPPSDQGGLNKILHDIFI